MHGSLNKTLSALLILIMCLLSHTALAQETVNTGVRVIHASTGQQHIDPGLRDLVPELRSVFRYTSYKLLNHQSMNLGKNQQGRVNLPGNRTLVVTPTNIQGKRINYNININRSGNPVFNTQVLLKNNSSITIGGPQFKKGVLLFNISGKR